MRYLLVALIAASASVSSAASIIVDVADTDSLPGFKTYTFSIETEGSEALRGVDATFTGAMNQVNPLGNASIFTDSNAFFPFVGANVTQDSQFKLASGSILSIGAAESSTLLKAAISGLAQVPNKANPFAFAQIVAQDPVAVDVSLDFDLGGAQAVAFRGSIQDFIIPEPTTCVLAGLALVGVAARRRV